MQAVRSVEIKSIVIHQIASKENGTGRYPVWMTQKSRKGDFRELKSKKFQGGTCHRTPLEACSFGACLRKLANIYLRSAPECCILLFVYLPNEFLDRCYKEKKHMNLMKLLILPYLLGSQLHITLRKFYFMFKAFRKDSKDLLLLYYVFY